MEELIGTKKGIIYNNEVYMLKFPPVAKGSSELSYSNGVFSEYISCKIFKSIGFDVQDVLLGKFTNKNGKEKIVVACKDFTDKYTHLQEFALFKNTIIDTPNNGYGTDLIEVLETIEEQDFMDKEELKEHFWNMFVVDSLLGNFDRHNGNWGFLVNNEKTEVTIAPIFDCGSCLFPQASDEQMKEWLETPEEMNKRTYIFPNSALKLNNKKINPHEFINSLKNEDLNQAILRIVPRINLNEINEIINNTPYISNIRKNFYQNIILKRYEEILLPAYEKLYNRELENLIEENKIIFSYLYDGAKFKGYFEKCYNEQEGYSLDLIKEDFKNKFISEFDKGGNNYFLYEDENTACAVNTKTHNIIKGSVLEDLLRDDPVE